MDLTTPRFWRDSRLPFIEARSVLNGRSVCYAKHSHDCFSIGAITNGMNAYTNGAEQVVIDTGTVVIMNPGDVHCCNPLNSDLWSYRMLYVDRIWLTNLQKSLGLSNDGKFQAFSAILTTDPQVYAEFNQFFTLLMDEQTECWQKSEAATTFFTYIHYALEPESIISASTISSPTTLKESHDGLERAADFIRLNCTRELRLEEISQVAERSTSYFIRSFKQKYGMTPHSYQINQRILFARSLLKQGRPIAEVACEAGFADQAHFQRTFKHLSAATPGQYLNY